MHMDNNHRLLLKIVELGQHTKLETFTVRKIS